MWQHRPGRLREGEAKVENRLNQIPTNHNPRFLPVLRPTLEVGVETLMVAARAWLSAAR
jgi:hippurate hydrolase